MGTKRVLLALGLVLLVCTGQAAAGIAWSDIGDGRTIWGHKGGSPATFYFDTWRNGVRDSQDTLGVPNFELSLSGFGYELGTGVVHRITFQYDNSDNLQPGPGTNGIMVPGDVFLDVNADFTWDYVLQTKFPTGNNVSYSEAAVEGSVAGFDTWNVYQLTDASFWNYSQNNSQFQLAQNAYTRQGDTWNEAGVAIRTDHPWRVADGILSDSSKASLLGTVDFSGWGDVGSNFKTTFAFSDANFKNLTATIDLGNQGDKIALIVGFTTNCANDVVWEPLSADLSVPEPASLAVWALGGLGAAGLAVRRRKCREARWSEENRQAIFAIVDNRR